MIELSGVDVHYGARKVLDAISFDAKKGTFVGIIGPNGSGKTTLLKAISRVITPTRRDYPARRAAAFCALQPRTCTIGRGCPTGNRARV